MKETIGFLFALCIGYLMFFGVSETHYASCEGQLTQRWLMTEGDDDLAPNVFPNTHAGLEIERFRWFVFWVDTPIRFSYSIGALDPSGKHQPERFSDYGIPIESFERTFVMSDFADSLDRRTVLFLDRRSGLLAIERQQSGASSISFDGFCQESDLLFD